jgi:hypothetical protein
MPWQVKREKNGFYPKVKEFVEDFVRSLLKGSLINIPSEWSDRGKRPFFCPILSTFGARLGLFGMESGNPLD